jgi:uncharacterized protein
MRLAKSFLNHFIYALVLAAFVNSLHAACIATSTASTFQADLIRAKAGDSNAAIRIGQAYAEGRVIPRDYRQALIWFHQAASSGSLEAEAWEVRFSTYRTADTHDWPGIFQRELQLADQKVAVAMLFVGVMYEEGEGTPKNLGKAAEMYEEATKSGECPRSLDSLGTLYYRGRGVQKDTAKATALWTRAAQLGDEWGEFHLAELYLKGDELPQNFAMAKQLFEQAASQGNYAAEERLGTMYEDGSGTAQDYSAALQWYKKSAETEYAPAEINLGRLYHLGLGGPQSNLSAYIWTAAAYTHTKDPDLLEALTSYSNSLDSKQKSTIPSRFALSTLTAR